MTIFNYNLKDLLYIVIVGLIFLVVDGVWLYFMREVFNNLIVNVQKSSLKIKVIPAVITYIIMTIGLYHFIIKQNKSSIEAIFLGLFVYGIYEGTNYAVFNNWNYMTGIADFIWGGVLFGITTRIFYIIKVHSNI